jgi:3-oxoadipate enol-lactonase
MPLAHVNGTTLNYRFDGPREGEVVMLSNSLASDLSMWDLQIPALVDAGYRTLRYDTRGHGGSAIPAGPYSIAQLAADAVGLLDVLGLEKVRFCGLSMGGMVGQALAAGHGERLIALVLSSTSAFFPLKEVWNERLALVRQSGMASVVDATIDRWFIKASQARLPGEVAKTREMIQRTPVEGFCGCGVAIREMDLRESLKAITVPTLVIVGEHDPGTPVSGAELIHAGIALSRLEVLADAAHFCNVEQKDRFNGLLLGFLRLPC